MKSRTNEEVTWSLLELRGLLEEEDSRVYFERTKKHVALHPFYLTNLQAALNEILSSTLNTYDKELKGFTLAYKNPKLLTSLGETFFDTCFIHIDIEADFYVFRPAVGCSLKGIVNKKGLDHIVVLIHKTFTVSIPKPDDTEEWPGDLVDIGQEVRCCVTHIDKSIKLPFICAALNSDYLQGCKLPERINNIDNIAIENNLHTSETVDQSIVSEDDISDRGRKKNRKKNIKKSREIDSETDYSSKKHKKNKITSKVSLDAESEIPVEIKIEKPDSTVDNMESDKQSFNNDTCGHNNVNLNGYVESRKAIKRENSVTDTIYEPEKKKRKKHSKKSRESQDRESVCITDNEEKICKKMKFFSDTSSFTQDDEEQYYKNKKRRVSNSDLSSSNFDINSTPKKHKESKNISIILDSNPVDNIEIKVEKPDSPTDKTITERLGNQISHDENTHNLENGNTKIHKHIKRENSSKEKRKRTTDKMSKDSDSELVSKIKSEEEVNNKASISRVIKSDGNEEHMKLNTSDLDISSSETVFKKPRKSKKSRKMSDSESEHHVKIKTENN